MVGLEQGLEGGQELVQGFDRPRRRRAAEGLRRRAAAGRVRRPGAGPGPAVVLTAVHQAQDAVDPGQQHHAGGGAPLEGEGGLQVVQRQILRQAARLGEPARVEQRGGQLARAVAAARRVGARGAHQPCQARVARQAGIVPQEPRQLGEPALDRRRSVAAREAHGPQPPFRAQARGLVRQQRQGDGRRAGLEQDARPQQAPRLPVAHRQGRGHLERTALLRALEVGSAQPRRRLQQRAHQTREVLVRHVGGGEQVEPAPVAALGPRRAGAEQLRLAQPGQQRGAVRLEHVRLRQPVLEQLRGPFRAPQGQLVARGGDGEVAALPGVPGALPGLAPGPHGAARAPRHVGVPGQTVVVPGQLGVELDAALEARDPVRSLQPADQVVERGGAPDPPPARRGGAPARRGPGAPLDPGRPGRAAGRSTPDPAPGRGRTRPGRRPPPPPPAPPGRGRRPSRPAPARAGRGRSPPSGRRARPAPPPAPAGPTERRDERAARCGAATAWEDQPPSSGARAGCWSGIRAALAARGRAPKLGAWKRAPSAARARSRATGCGSRSRSSCSPCRPPPRRAATRRSRRRRPSPPRSTPGWASTTPPWCRPRSATRPW